MDPHDRAPRQHEAGLGGALRDDGPDAGSSSVTFSQLVPLFTTRLFDRSRKSYLVPGIATILVAVVAFALLGQIGPLLPKILTGQADAIERSTYFTAVTRFGVVL